MKITTYIAMNLGMELESLKYIFIKMKFLNGNVIFFTIITFL